MEGVTEGRQSQDGSKWVRGDSDEEGVTEGRQSRDRDPIHPS